MEKEHLEEQIYLINQLLDKLKNELIYHHRIGSSKCEQRNEIDYYTDMLSEYEFKLKRYEIF